MSHATATTPVSTAELARADFLAIYEHNTRLAYEIDLRILFDWAALYDRAKRSLDRHGNYALASWISGAS